MMSGAKLNTDEYQRVLMEYIDNYFQPLMDKEIYSLIINRNFEVEIATNHSIKSLGFNDWQQFNQISLKDYNNPEALRMVFGDKYSSENHHVFEFYGKKIHFLQQLVFEQAKVIKFIDMLPYNGQFINRLAFDFVPLKDGKLQWNDLALFKRCGKIARALALEWGGDWQKFRDYPHCQFT